jgi:TetR/AcrR family transcriptional regulator
MSEANPSRAPRDPERTRAAILDAAEALFAQRGFDATSLGDIGAQAGVSRGTPNYVFGTKEALYRAVLERVLQAEHDSIAQVQARLAQAGSGASFDLREMIRAHLEFLLARPTFLQLLAREALQGGRELQATQGYLAVLEAGLDMIRAAQRDGAIRPIDPAHLLLNIVALCWFPFLQAATIARGLGLDVSDPGFVEQHVAQVTDLLVRGIQPT